MESNKNPLGLKKGAWTKEEDDLLRRCIEKYGEGRWHQVPLRAGLNRCRKSCRLRWLNYLRPNIKRGCFKEDEVDLIVRLHKLLGNRWSLIAGRIPGRTANDIKNFWNANIEKKQRCRTSSSEDNVVVIKDSPHDHAMIFKPQPRIFSFNKPPTTNNNNLGGANHCATHHHDPSQQHQLFQDDERISWWKNLLEEAAADAAMDDHGDEGRTSLFLLPCNNYHRGDHEEEADKMFWSGPYGNNI